MSERTFQISETWIVECILELPKQVKTIPLRRGLNELGVNVCWADSDGKAIQPLQYVLFFCTSDIMIIGDTSPILLSLDAAEFIFDATVGISGMSFGLSDTICRHSNPHGVETIIRPCPAGEVSDQSTAVRSPNPYMPPPSRFKPDDIYNVEESPLSIVETNVEYKDP